MKKNLSLGGVALGILAAALAGCADEEGANKPEQVKSAITSRGFVANGCTGTGVFDVSSNDLINFVALDQSSFNSVNAEVYALDKNNQEQLIASTQSSSAISSSLAQLLNEVSNFQSAAQRARQLAESSTSSIQNAYAANVNTSDSVATTATTTSHQAEANSRQFTRRNASGWSNQESSSDVNSWSNASNSSRQTAAATAAQFNAQISDISNFANAGQHADAQQGSLNIANSARNAGTASDSVNAVHSNADNGATSIADITSTRSTSAFGAAPVGWGWGGMGWGDVNTLSSFNRSDVWSSQFADAVNSTRAAANNSATANLVDKTFSNVFSDANQNSFNHAGSNARNSQISKSISNAEQANQVSNQASAHNDQRTHTAYDTNDYREIITGTREDLTTADSATTANHARNANTSLSKRAANATNRADSLSESEQLNKSNARNSSLNQQLNKQFQSMENLSRFNSNNLVVKLSVTANSENAVIRMFTGNNSNNVATSQDFSQTFAGCGVGAAVVTPKLLPGTLSPAAAEANAAQLGDRVAKPE